MVHDSDLSRTSWITTIVRYSASASGSVFRTAQVFARIPTILDPRAQEAVEFPSRCKAKGA